MIGITLKTIKGINSFLEIHSIVLTIENNKWHVLTEDTFKSFKESLHYDIDYRVDGNFQFTNIIIIDKFNEIRITDKSILNSMEEFKQAFGRVCNKVLFMDTPKLAKLREE